MTWPTLWYSLPPALTATFLIVLAAVPLMRGRPQAVNRIFMLLCLFGSFLNLDILIQLNATSAAAALRSSRIGHILHPFLLPLFIHFFHAYLKIKRRRWLISAAYACALFLSACSQSDLMISGVKHFSFGFSCQGGKLYPLMALGAAFTTVYNLFILYRAIMMEKQSGQKNRLKYVFAGFVILGLVTSLNVLTRFGLAVYPPGNFGFVPLVVFAAGLFRHDLLDMGMVIRKGLLYSSLTGVLTGLYALVIIAAQKMFARTWQMDSIPFAVILFAMIALIFGPVRNRIQKIIDHLFAKGRYDYQQTIKNASRSIASAMDYPAITRLLKETIVDAMQVAHCILFLHYRRENQYRTFAAAGSPAPCKKGLSFASEDAAVRCLQRMVKPLIRSQLTAKSSCEEAQGLLAMMTQLQAELVLPLIFKNRLNGFIVLGGKESGEMYSVEDLNLLETLSLSSALAIENARAYQALNKLNRTLESKVADRTRDLRKALQEKERTQEQLIRSESLAALGQLVAGAAHELNNPLASVTSLLQSAVEELENREAGAVPDEALMDDLNFAGRELGRVKSIVASLLGLARQTQTYTEAVDLNVVSRDALRVLHSQYRHTGIEFLEDYDGRMPVVEGNFANLGQVVLNIIKNAIQAVDPDGGRIALRTYHQSNPSQAVFVCRDNGPGIAAHIRRDVFKPFFTTKPVGQGTGLGLYICHEIVRKHGGTLELESTRPGGTVVTVRLPIGQQAATVGADP